MTGSSPTLPDIDIYQGYGMTENCGLLTCLGPEEHRRGGDILRLRPPDARIAGVDPG